MTLRQLIRVGFIAHAVVLVGFGVYGSTKVGEDHWQQALPFIEFARELEDNPHYKVAQANTCIGGTCTGTEAEGQGVIVDPGRRSRYTLFDEGMGLPSWLVFAGLFWAGIGVAITQEPMNSRKL